jgi:hypothetical protein
MSDVILHSRDCRWCQQQIIIFSFRGIPIPWASRTVDKRCSLFGATVKSSPHS